MNGYTNQHTPGPWEFAETASGHYGIWGGENWLATTRWGTEPVRERANARLIAAAPALLAAAKAVIDERDSYLMSDEPAAAPGTVDALYNELRTAIAKAEGSEVLA